MAESRTQKLLLTHKKPIRAVLLVLAIGLLASAPLLVGYSHVKMQDAWTAIMRTSGLLAFTLIFMNLVTGPLSKWFYVLFKPKRVYYFHIATGAAGFALAVMHGVIVFVMAHYRYHPATWLIGPIALGLMIVTMSVAANKKRLPQLWRRIHPLNYTHLRAHETRHELVCRLLLEKKKHKLQVAKNATEERQKNTQHDKAKQRQ